LTYNNTNLKNNNKKIHGLDKLRSRKTLSLIIIIIKAFQVSNTLIKIIIIFIIIIIEVRQIRKIKNNFKIYFAIILGSYIVLMN
jgi:hypothetical protein